MNLAIYIGQGIGLALAAGLRPFLPALLAGALAGADVELDFAHTNFAFLQSRLFLLAVVVVLCLSYLLQHRLGSERFHSGPAGAALSGLSLGVGAVLFAAVLDQHGDAWWPGILGGLACAALTQAATRGVLARARGRLVDAAAREAVAVYTDGASLLAAAIAVFAWPLSYVMLVGVVWLLWAGRRREGQKFAGLRVLR
jgi:hypothetical protein